MLNDQLVAPAPQQQYAGQSNKSKGLAVAGFVLALVGVLMSFVPVVNVFGNVIALLGLTFGVIGLIRSRNRRACPGLSIAAILLALAAFVISAVINAAAVAVLEGKVEDVGTAQNIPTVPAGKIGQSVTDGDFTFAVRSVSCGMPTSGGSLPSIPHGQFCAVRVLVSNHGQKAQLFDASQVEGFIAGSRYGADSAASVTANPNTAAFLTGISPGRSTNAIVLIDVPVGQRLDAVELHDTLLSAGTSVSVR